MCGLQKTGLVVLFLGLFSGAQAVPIHSIEAINWAKAETRCSFGYQYFVFNSETKFCPMSSSSREDIVVFDPAPCVPKPWMMNWVQFSHFYYCCRSMQFGIRADDPVAKIFRIREIKVITQGGSELPCIRVDYDVFSRALAAIEQNRSYTVAMYPSFHRTMDAHGGGTSVGNQIDFLCGHVSPQLMFSSRVRASYETYGSTPKHQSDNREQPFAWLNSKDHEFRRVLAATFFLLSATWVYLRGWCITGWLMATYAIFGLMLKIDLWSLIIRVI